MNVYVITLYDIDNADESVMAVVVAENSHVARQMATEECSLNVDESRTECVLIDEDCSCVVWCD
jgi:hypothetical protein